VFQPQHLIRVRSRKESRPGLSYGRGSAAVQINPIPFPLTIGYFLSVNAQGFLYWAPIAAGGITSVFGRAGPAIVAISGDYTPTQVGFSSYPLTPGVDYPTPATGIPSTPPAGFSAITNIYYDPATGQLVYTHA